MFTAFDRCHLGILAAMAILAWVLAVLALRSARSERGISWSLAGILATTEVFLLWRSLIDPASVWTDNLPMHLCDWAAISAIVALTLKWRLAYEAAFFWSLGGSLQAVLTPDIDSSTPMPVIVAFFVTHCTAIIGVLVLTVVTPLRPHPASRSGDSRRA